MKIPFWGCPMLNFRSDLPFHVMRPVYAAFEKEIPMALKSKVGVFKTLKCYLINKYVFISSNCQVFLRLNSLSTSSGLNISDSGMVKPTSGWYRR